MSKDDVLLWRVRWGNRLMHPDAMSRARRSALMQEVDDMVSIRDRTIEALLDAVPGCENIADSGQICLICDERREG